MNYYIKTERKLENISNILLKRNNIRSSNEAKLRIFIEAK